MAKCCFNAIKSAASNSKFTIEPPIVSHLFLCLPIGSEFIVDLGECCVLLLFILLLEFTNLFYDSNTFLTVKVKRGPVVEVIKD